MPTGQVIINNALTALGILEQGGVPSPSDSTWGLTELNDLWNIWGIDEGMIFAEQQQQFAWLANAASVPIGPAAAAPFNVTLPSRIYRAIWVTASGRNEIEIVSAKEFFAHNDLAATASTPDQLYPDWLVDPTSGGATLRPWPVPNANATLELNTGAEFKAWALATNYKLPQGFQDAVTWCLAFRLMPSFGVLVRAEVAQMVTAMASKSENRIREMNRANRQMPAGSEAVPAPAAAAKG